MRIVVATHNEGKLAEMRNILEAQLGDLSQEVELVSAASLSVPDPVETGLTFAQNAMLKAEFVAKYTGLPAIADDSGLIVDVLGAAPGILSARWAGVHGHDRANTALLLAQIEDIPDEDRKARFECAAALVYPSTADKCTGEAASEGVGEELVHHVEIGRMDGAIIRKPRGSNGFGYDPIFVPNDQPEGFENEEFDDFEDDSIYAHMLTSAQLSEDQKNAISHRGKALHALMKHLLVLLEDTQKTNS